MPTTLIISPTASTLRTATLKEWEKVLPRKVVLKKRRAPQFDYILTNGHYIKGYSGEAEIEGVTACTVWVDEIQHPAFSSSPTKFANYLARLRDELATKCMMIVSGLPMSGFVRETLDKEWGEDGLVVLAGTRDNPHIPDATVANFLTAMSASEAATLLEGRWMAPTGGIYPEFDPEVHLTRRGPDPRAPVHLAIDVGERGGALFGQEIKVDLQGVTGHPAGQDTGLLVYDQMLFANESVEAMAYRIKLEHPLADNIVAGRSKICVDPTIRRDERAALAKVFPGVSIIARSRKKDGWGDSADSVEAGIRQVKRGFRDALGNVRLLLSDKLNRAPYKNGMGLVDGLETYRRRDGGGAPVKDNYRDHVLDCLRYLVCEIIPAQRPAVQVR